MSAADTRPVTPFQLLQWKHWLRMEVKAGRMCRHSSGRSVKAHAERMLGLPKRSKREHVLACVEACLEAAKAAGVGMTQLVDFNKD